MIRKKIIYSAIGRVVFLVVSFSLLSISIPAFAATSIPLTINMSEAVNVTGTPRVAVDVGGVTRYATYTSGTGTSALTFTYTMTAGDVDLDGVTLTSPLQLNGGTIKDLNGNDATLTFSIPNTSNVKVNYPSLGMDFIYDADGRYTLNGTAYNDLSSFLTATGGSFSRASIGTYYDSSGVLQTATSNTPRFDYDPVTHTPKGILIEEQRTNIIPSSGVFSGTGWNVDGAILNVGGTMPSGGNNATSISQGPGNNRIYCFDNSGVTGSKVFSIFVKSNVGNTFSVSAVGGMSPSGVATINTSTGSITGAFPSATAISIGNGWFRFIIPVSVSTASGNSTYWSISGPTNSVYIWGAQLEQGSFPTSYIPTTTATVTRQADNLSIPIGGWFNSNASTQYSNFYAPSNVSANNRIIGYNGSGCMLCFTGQKLVSWDTNLILTANSIVVSSQNKGGSSYSSAGKSIVLNGGTVVTGLSGTNPVSGATIFHLGSNGGGSDFLNGTIMQLKHYPTRISDTQLQLMTQ